MSLIKNLIEKRMAEYETQKPYSTGNYAPRRGFYLIKGIVCKSLGPYPFGNVPMGICLWSPDGKSFLENSEIEIMLPPLFQPASNRPNDVSVDGIVNQIIQIMDFGFVKLRGDEAFPHALVLTWKKSENSIPVITANMLAVGSMIPKGQTLGSLKFDVVENPDDFDDLTAHEIDEDIKIVTNI